MASSRARRGSGWILGKFLPWKRTQGLAPAVEPLPGRVPDPGRAGTLWWGLLGMFGGIWWSLGLLAWDAPHLSDAGVPKSPLFIPPVQGWGWRWLSSGTSSEPVPVPGTPRQAQRRLKAPLGSPGCRKQPQVWTGPRTGLGEDSRAGTKEEKQL